MLITIAPMPPWVELVDASGKYLDSVQFGLFDRAFDPATVLLNSDADEKDNFVGSDSRRFYVRVYDVSQHVDGVKKPREVRATWRTHHSDMKTVLDDGGMDAAITLVETAAGSGEFKSSWLLLSSDPWEIGKVPTTTGRAGLGLRSRGTADYRLRLGSMFGHTSIEFPEKSGNWFHRPIFRRSPDERRNIPLQIFVQASAYKPGMESYILGPDLENMRVVYARLGLWVWSTVDPAHRLLPGVIPKKIGKEELLVVPDPIGIKNPLAPTWPDLERMTRLYPGLLANGSSGSPPSSTGMACSTDTIRVFYVPSLPSGHFGDTCPDAVFANDARRGASFVADAGSKVASGMGSSAAHEIGHSLTNHSSGHYDEPVPPLRLHAASNLMADGSVGASGGVGSSQRLWDSPDATGLNQWIAIRSSRYTRG